MQEIPAVRPFLTQGHGAHPGHPLQPDTPHLEMVMGTRHASPELALQALEAAYASRDPDAAVAARDFVSEAGAMLRDVLGVSDPTEERVRQSARMPEHAFRTPLEDDGFPDMVTTSRRLVAVRMVRPELAALVQECTFPDGSVAEEITHAIRTADGWGIVELHGEAA